MSRLYKSRRDNVEKSEDLQKVIDAEEYRFVSLEAIRAGARRVSESSDG